MTVPGKSRHLIFQIRSNYCKDFVYRIRKFTFCHKIKMPYDKTIRIHKKFFVNSTRGNFSLSKFMLSSIHLTKRFHRVPGIENCYEPSILKRETCIPLLWLLHCNCYSLAANSSQSSPAVFVMGHITSRFESYCFLARQFDKFTCIILELKCSKMTKCFKRMSS